MCEGFVVYSKYLDCVTCFEVMHYLAWHPLFRSSTSTTKMASAASRRSLASTSRLASTRCLGSRGNLGILSAVATDSQRPPGLHSSSNRHAVSPFRMPAMSPTMTEGGISAWKKQEGQSFVAGDVLLEMVRTENHMRELIAHMASTCYVGNR
jgi:hypothetical protein